jgi:SAM-dependent methyltransferase
VSCRLAFADPLSLPDSPEALYGDAYRGLSADAGMEEYHHRVNLRERRKLGQVSPETMQFWGAFGRAMDWLMENVPRGSTLLDIGCGMGYFITAARERGFVPVGLDVAQEVVDLLSDEGFSMWHGTVDSVPDGWHQPTVCTSFFVMHHMPDPVGFLSTVRAKFPQATLLVSAWNRYPLPPVLAPAGSPPRTVTWWSPHALRRAFEEAGYTVEHVFPLLEHYAFGLPAAARRNRRSFSDWALETGHYRLFSAYHAIKPRAYWPLKMWKRLRGKASSVLVVGRP